MKGIVEVEQLLALAFHQFGDRDPRPAGDDLCDLLLGNGIAEQGCLTAAVCRLFFLFVKLFCECREFAVFKLCGFGEVVGILCAFDVGVGFVDLLTELLNLADGVLFDIQLCLHCVELFAHIGKLFLCLCKSFERELVGFL